MKVTVLPVPDWAWAIRFFGLEQENDELTTRTGRRILKKNRERRSYASNEVFPLEDKRDKPWIRDGRRKFIW